MSASEVRLKLRKRGFAPIPVSGKVPPLKEWGKRADTSDGDIEIWEKLFPQATNTGILTALAPCLDIDILDPAAADSAEQAVRERFDEHGAIRVRFGRSPKRCRFFRTNEDDRVQKITVDLVATNGDTDR